MFSVRQSIKRNVDVVFFVFFTIVVAGTILIANRIETRPVSAQGSNSLSQLSIYLPFILQQDGSIVRFTPFDEAEPVLIEIK